MHQVEQPFLRRGQFVDVHTRRLEGIRDRVGNRAGCSESDSSSARTTSMAGTSAAGPVVNRAQWEKTQSLIKECIARLQR